VTLHDTPRDAPAAPSTAATTASAGAVCASGSTARPTAIVSIDGTATHSRPRRSMTLPAG